MLVKIQNVNMKTEEKYFKEFHELNRKGFTLLLYHQFSFQFLVIGPTDTILKVEATINQKHKYDNDIGDNLIDDDDFNDEIEDSEVEPVFTLEGNDEKIIDTTQLTISHEKIPMCISQYSTFNSTRIPYDINKFTTILEKNKWIVDSILSFTHGRVKNRLFIENWINLSNQKKKEKQIK